MTPSKLIKRLRVDDPDRFRLAAFDPADTGDLDKDDVEAMLADDLKRLAELQQRLYADGRWALSACGRKDAVDIQGPMTNRIPQGRAAFPNHINSNFPGATMSPIARFSAALIVATVAAQTAVLAQGLEVKRYNPSEWTKGRFSEVVTVNGPGKTVYLAGIGAEDENGPAGASASILHPGNPYEQCRYAYDKIKRLLAAHGASLADAVKQVVYVTDVRFQADVAKCRREAYGDGPIPANTFLVISALAIPGMLLEIDVTAVVGK
jgi:enamine deaminase RidA (YjgF/YER057c/UK114 family)